MYSNKQKVSTLKEAAVVADEYTLTHEIVFVQKREVAPREILPGKDPPSPQKAFVSRTETDYFYCHKLGHVVVACPSLKCKNQSPEAKQSKRSKFNLNHPC